MHKLLGVALMGALFIPAVSSAATVADLEAQIQALMQQLQALQAQLQILQGGTAWCHTFSANLKIDNRGDEVQALHVVLAKEGFTISDSEQPQKDGETSYGHLFGESTASAVTGFQEKYKDDILTPVGLKYGTGYGGPSTRAKLNKLYGCGNTSSSNYISFRFDPAVPDGASILHSTLYVDVASSKNPVKVELYAGTTGTGLGDDYMGSLIGTNTDVAYRAGESGIRTFKFSVNSCPANPVQLTAKVYFSDGTFDNKGSQLLSCNTQSSIKVLSPNGGESWQIGSTQTVKWTSANLGGVCGSDKASNACAEYYARTVYGSLIDSSGRAFDLFNAKEYTGNAQITVPSTIVPGLYTLKLKVYSEVGYDVFDSSDAPFTIAAAGTATPFTILSPVAGAVLNQGSTYKITWSGWDTNSNGSHITNYAVYLVGGSLASTAGSKYLGTVDLNTQNWFSWTVPADVAPASGYQIQFSGAGATGGNSGLFTIAGAGAATPSITLLSPQANSTLAVGFTVNISWSATGGGFDKYQIVVRNSVTKTERQLYDKVSMIDYLPATQTSYQWLVPDLLSDFAKGSSYSFDQIKNSFSLQIRSIKNDSAGGSYVVSSDKTPFSVAASATTSSISVLSPNGGEVWRPGETHQIQWNANGMSAVRIYLYYPNAVTNGGLTGTVGSGPISYVTNNGSSVPASPGYYNWTIPPLNQLLGGGGNNYWIRIDNADNLVDGTPRASSTAPFTITAATPALSVKLDTSSPAAGRVVSPGQTNVVVGIFNFTAQNSDVLVNSITIGGNSPYPTTRNFANIKLFDGTTQLGSAKNLAAGASIGYGANFDMSWTIPGNTSKTLTVTADIPVTAYNGATDFLALAGLGSSQNIQIVGGSLVYGNAISIQSPSVTISSVSSTAPGATTTVSWTNSGTTFAKDWIGIAPHGGQWSSSYNWFYTDGLSSGSKTITMPSTAGSYDLVYYLNNGFIEIGRAGPITIFTNAN